MTSPSPVALALALHLALAAPALAAPVQVGDLLAKSPASDWRAIDPENTLYMELPDGRVVIELAPAFAPNHVANIKALVRSGYFDASAIVRVQDNYVVQWSAPETRKITAGHDTLKAEFDKPIGPEPFVRLADPDTYAPVVGFSGDFPVARDPRSGKTWLVHCYGMVGAGRDDAADSGGGKELYAVIGQSPRNLDRNVTLVGRVVQGIEWLSSLPRGPGDMGFYAHDADKVVLRSIKVAADLPASERLSLEALRTDSATFRALVQARRFRREGWYKYSPGRIGVCNVPLPVRVAP
jgi:peptidylprolyl isomerase